MAVTILLKLSWSTAQNIYFNDFYGSRCPVSVVFSILMLVLSPISCP